MQYEFRGFRVGPDSATPKTVRPKASSQKIESHWLVEDGVNKFRNGQEFLVGEEPGLYEVEGENQYWDGEEWSRPKKKGTYLLLGEEYYWDGASWE